MGSGWRTTSSLDPNHQDPLRDHYGQPLISMASPDKPNYVGRVMVELWEGDGSDDSLSIGVGIDPADRSRQEELVRRVAAALAASIERR